ncbi:MAG: Uracil DNA glycosylase superfamily protein [Alphaproteobacteria bacterium ADurb.Bin438]|nr:MAG: Uracil DNA glycosylase superfamily protein [Alphaproteobacteria bacterium ADurb.Bin438]
MNLCSQLVNLKNVIKMGNTEQELEKLKEKCLNCDKCELCNTRNKVVFGCGIPNNKIVLIGEAPGFYEDKSGIPFVGKAGQLLDKILESQEFSRNRNIYICNIIKCRPPENRDPNDNEKQACRPYLEAQLELLKPKIILLCGKVSAHSFINTNEGITKLRGKWYNGPYGSKMMPIFHPSYLLRNESHEKGSPKWLMWQDIKEIKQAYDKL